MDNASEAHSWAWVGGHHESYLGHEALHLAPSGPEALWRSKSVSQAFQSMRK